MISPLPGAPAFAIDLNHKLQSRYQRRYANMPISDAGRTYTNRLLLETSPYLLQHAHNPVNWYPWGEEAFAEAARLNLPVLLSVGYSTCHWCHVMEHESFENTEIARYLNENYIAIKVDREERPDIDAVYMAAVQTLTGHGGWPMTVFLTPDRRPFFGGTYFPAHNGDRGARVGFSTLLRELKSAYLHQQERVQISASEIVDAIQLQLNRQTATKDNANDGLLDADTLHKAYRYYARQFDRNFGGLHQAPKFPANLPIRFLLRYHARFGDPEALYMAERSLDAMAAGGIFDQVGGGFHRYSVDEYWLVPHFEKMLYDNALLATAYCEAWQLTGHARHADMTRRILDYVLREMTAEDGAFYSATDADSHNPETNELEEGWFFTWTPAELEQVLGLDLAAFISEYYNVQPHGHLDGRNIFHRDIDDLQLAPAAEEQDKLTRAHALLYAARAQRPAPLRDEKILVAWNALMISALARAGFALNEDRYVQQACKAADFILGQMLQNGRLQRSYAEGQARFAAYLEDYAAMVAALLDLYHASGEFRYFEQALKLDQIVEHTFEDSARGGCFMTAHDHEELIVREKPSYDGAMPSGNSLQLQNLLRLYDLTGSDRYRQRTDLALTAFADILQRTPAALAEMLTALDHRQSSGASLVLMAHPAADIESFLAPLRRRFLPYLSLCIHTSAVTGDQAMQLPLLRDKIPHNTVTAYICQQQTCGLPISDAKEFSRQLDLLTN